MWQAQVTGDGAEFDDLRDTIARSIHEAHGGDADRGCFLCRRSAVVALQALCDSGYVIVSGRPTARKKNPPQPKEGSSRGVLRLGPAETGGEANPPSAPAGV